MGKDLTQNSEVEVLASLQFTIEEIVTITGEKNLDMDIVNRGRLKASAEVRKSILAQAKQGSSPAQKEFIGLVKTRIAIERGNNGRAKTI